MKLDKENRYTREVPLGTQVTQDVEVLRLSAYQLKEMGIPDTVAPGMYALERNDQGFVYALTPVEIETVSENEQFMNDKRSFNSKVLQKLRG